MLVAILADICRHVPSLAGQVGRNLLPRVAVVDPTMTYSMTPEVTASTGLDALTQLIEPFTSIRLSVPVPHMMLLKSPNPSIDTTAASSNGEAKNALAR